MYVEVLLTESAHTVLGAGETALTATLVSHQRLPPRPLLPLPRPLPPLSLPLEFWRFRHSLYEWFLIPQYEQACFFWQALSEQPAAELCASHVVPLCFGVEARARLES